MLIDYQHDQDSIILRVKILDSSATTGAGLTGLTSASAGLIISTIADNEDTATTYTQAGSTIETIATLGTYEAPTATKCRFKEVDAAGHPGVYEIQLADARFSVASAKSLLVSVSGAANAAETDAVIPLRGLDPYDATLQETLFADGTVWVDPTGTDSTAWPYGSAPYPTSTIANGKTIADARKIQRISITGVISLAAAMEGYQLIGSGNIDVASLIDINSQSIEHSTLRNLTVTGVGGNAALVSDQTRYSNCLLYDHTNINGVVQGGSLGGACSIRDTGYALFTDVFFGQGAACTLTVQAPTKCDIINMRGTLTISGMDGGILNITLTDGSFVTIDNTCTAGTITMTGIGNVTDNSGGATVIALADTPTVLHAATDALQATIITHLTDIKGAGWTDEDLKSISEAVNAIVVGEPRNITIDGTNVVIQD
jgi:hypothetical protein